jgi:hypothetical protein
MSIRKNGIIHLRMQGIVRTKVGSPVRAQRVDTTAESIPPDTPTTSALIPLLSAYSLNPELRFFLLIQRSL